MRDGEITSSLKSVYNTNSFKGKIDWIRRIIQYSWITRIPFLKSNSVPIRHFNLFPASRPMAMIQKKIFQGQSASSDPEKKSPWVGTRWKSKNSRGLSLEIIWFPTMKKCTAKNFDPFGYKFFLKLTLIKTCLKNLAMQASRKGVGTHPPCTPS